jgi:anti-sigma regulatory factor (Ser/Thr protein kinase)
MRDHDGEANGVRHDETDWSFDAGVLSPRVNLFSHEAFIYSSAKAFVAGTLPFLQEGLERGEGVLAVLSPEKVDVLRSELAADAHRVRFADMTTAGANPARIIPLWRKFVDERRPGTAVRGIGEPIHAARSSAELVECQQHESLLNHAFDATTSFRLLCPYDVALGPDILEEAARSHPFVYSTGRVDPSMGWDLQGAPSRPYEAALPNPSVPFQQLAFALGQLQELRAFVTRQAQGAGFDAERTSDIVLAVNEVATNSLRYGGRRGTLTIWREGPTLICEVHDTGQIADPLVGRVLPNPTSVGGFGLWLVNHLCDLVQVRTGPGGSVIRLHIRPTTANR